MEIKLGQSIALLLCAAIVSWCLIPSSAVAQDKEVGTIAALEGAPMIVHEGVTYIAKINLKVYLGDTVKTPSMSKISITFKDGSILNLGEDSEIVVNQFVYSQAKRTRTSRFNVISGKMRVLVSKLTAFRESRYQLETPTAIIGIRGSDFIITLAPFEEGAATRDYPLVASLDYTVSSDSIMVAQGGLQITNALCLDGSGSITSKAGGGAMSLTPGTMGSVVTGRLPVIQPIPSELLETLREATGVSGAPQTPIPPSGARGGADIGAGIGSQFLMDIYSDIVPEAEEDRQQEKEELLEGAGGVTVRTNFDPTTPTDIRVDFRD